MALRDQRGMTLVELIAVVATASLVLTTGLLLSMPLLARETLVSAVHHADAFVQLAKIEAASRSVPCRMVLDTEAWNLSVWDTRGTSTADDDLLLHEGPLPNSVRLGRPDGGASITLAALGGGHRFQALLAPNGAVLSGAGDLFLQGADSFARLSLFVGGGVEIRYWDGADWRVGA